MSIHPTQEVNGHTWYQGPMACDRCDDHQAIYCETCGVITLTFHVEDREGP